MLKIEREISTILLKNKSEICEAVISKQYELFPELPEKYGEFGRSKCLTDTEYNLSFLAEAISGSSPELFLDYIIWASLTLSARNVSIGDFTNNLNILKDILKNFLPEEYYLYAKKYIEEGLSKLRPLPPEPPSFIEDNQPYNKTARDYLNALLNGDRHLANKIILECANSGIKIKDIYLHIFQISQYEAGRLWQLNKISVAKEHYITAATQHIMSQLYPYIFSLEKNGLTMVATCIEDDFHELGIRMISDVFEIAGWDSYYIGANTPITSIISTITEKKPDLVAVSCTMTFNLKKVEQLINTIHSSDNCKNIKIIVGGYPFNISPDLWKKVGADGYASNAEEALVVSEQLILEQ